MKKLIIIFTMLFLVFTTCDTTDPKPLEEKPPGYQEDIHWPSLANSPWPMYHGDPQATGRLKGVIPVFSIIEKKIEKYFTVSGAVVGEDSCFYFVSTGSPSGLVCLKPNGDQKWLYKIPPSFGVSGTSAPLITKSGNIIFGSNAADSIYSISPNGKLNWRVNLKCRNEINIGKDGTIYAFSTEPKALNAISSNGNILWSLEEQDLFTLSTAISPDGNTIYSLGVNGIALIAIDLISQDIKWKIKAEEPDIYRAATPLVDNQGNVYIYMREENSDTNGIYSYSAKGVLNWKVLLPDEGYSEPENPAMDRDGHLYIGLVKLNKIDHKGKLIWRENFNLRWISSELLIDNNNSILFVVNKPFGDGIESLTQLDDKGNNINLLSLPNYGGAQYFAPAISFNSILLPISYNLNTVLLIK